MELASGPEDIKADLLDESGQSGRRSLAPLVNAICWNADRRCQSLNLKGRSSCNSGKGKARRPEGAAPSRIQETQLTPDKFKAASDKIDALQSIAPRNDVVQDSWISKRACWIFPDHQGGSFNYR